MTVNVVEKDNDDRRNVAYIDLMSCPNGYNMSVVAERLSYVINKINPDDVLTIMDIGSMDAWNSINLSRMFNEATVYTFEPVKANHNTCDHNIAQQREQVKTRIHLQRIALNNTTGPMTFWELDELAASKHGNLNHGIASKYQLMNPNIRPWEYSVQRPVTVVGYRIDDWCKENNVSRVDVIWMNVQGAELDVLQGAGLLLDTVQFIITTVGLKPSYHGQSVKADIDTFLINHGFVEWVPARRIANRYNANVIYLNKRYANF